MYGLTNGIWHCFLQQTLDAGRIGIAAQALGIGQVTIVTWPVSYNVKKEILLCSKNWKEKLAEVKKKEKKEKKVAK